MHSESTGICPGIDHGTQGMAESTDMSLSMSIYPSCKTRDIHTISTQAMSPHSLILCRRRRKTEYFIHTGRTRKASWEAARNSMVRIISGERLLLLIDKNSNFNLEDK